MVMVLKGKQRIGEQNLSSLVGWIIGTLKTLTLCIFRANATSNLNRIQTLFLFYVQCRQQAHHQRQRGRAYNSDCLMIKDP
jgi:hypothetical protein